MHPPEVELLRLAQVSKRYRSARPLRGADLVIGTGEAVGVVGANGSGKSTLLRLAARLSRPSGGAVRGDPTTGYVPDRFPAQQRMGACEYLRHAGRMRGLPAAETEQRAAHWLDRFWFAGGLDTPMRRLSKGNAQKVGLAQALLADPELLVLDEPWSGLDGPARDVLAEVVAERVEEGAAVLFTEHQAGYARTAATRSLRLVDGVLTEVAERPPEVRIVLDGPVPPERWAQREGVRRVRPEPDGTELVVEVAQREPVLAEAIDAGCAVLAVQEVEEPA